MMKQMVVVGQRWWLAVMALSLCALTSCGFNDVIDADEDVKAKWAEVENQYKRRADLVPNLVQTVKGAANFETDTLQKVVEARSRVSGVQVDSHTIDNPEKLREFEAAQRNLGSALSRLMVVVEKYPELKATASFQELQAQIEGTENRIAVARKRFIDGVAEYNKIVQRFPSMIGASLRGKQVRPTLENPGLDKPPEIKF